MTRRGKTGLGVYADGMVKLDKIVGELTQTVADLGIEENTIVIFGPITEQR